MVITAAGLMLHSLYRLSQVDPGFRTDHTVTAEVSLDAAACKQKGRCAVILSALLDRMQSIPGVERAALADSLPLNGREDNYVFDAEDHPRERAKARAWPPDAMFRRDISTCWTCSWCTGACSTRRTHRAQPRRRHQRAHGPAPLAESGSDRQALSTSWTNRLPPSGARRRRRWWSASCATRAKEAWRNDSATRSTCP